MVHIRENGKGGIHPPGIEPRHDGEKPGGEIRRGPSLREEKRRFIENVEEISYD